MDEVRPLLEGKITLLSGNSGVGKSTLMNCLVPDANLRTGEISDAHNTGQHTTTFSEMIPLEGRGWLIDTPGIKARLQPGGQRCILRLGVGEQRLYHALA